MEYSAAVVGQIVGRLLEHNERALEHSAALVKAAMERGTATTAEAMNDSVVKRSLDYCDLQVDMLRPNIQNGLDPDSRDGPLHHSTHA